MVVEDWLEIDKRRVYYQAVAEAAELPPLVLIHGISCSTDTWKPFVEVLAKREDAPEVFVPDLPAHGRSEKPAQLLSIGDYGEWVERFCEAARLPVVDVMGHSMGCQVALALAQLHPERVRRLVLLGPTTGGKHVSALRNFAGLLGDSTREPMRYNLLLQKIFFGMGPLRYLLTVREMQRDEAFARAREVRCPALVVQGVRDAIVPKRIGKELAAALPCGSFARIRGAAHAAQYSHPHETVEAVLRYLTLSP